ncbi:alpha/beta-hydrolase family protein [Williamsia deligens]|uniref:Alpha/beta-hydrolase family protein n=1 Tax=Williamsia deligens TaxID=321325 RepID=A0ABW3G1L2_9NOCA|nr:alpha/beta-hydrolase family protein [Williamsia deligens]MCP2195042.1 Alpha/beta-hydrolase family protein [Williamsia deligens]
MPLRPAGMLGALAGAAVALAPNSLPRDASVQMVLLGVSVVVGAALGTVVGRAVRGPRRADTAATVAVTVVAIVVVGMLVAANTLWQSALRSAMPGAAPLGPGWVLWSVAPIAALYAAAVSMRTPRSAVRLAAAAVVAACLTGAAPVALAAPAPTGADVARTAVAVPHPIMITGSVEARTAGPAAIHRAAQDVVARWRSAGGGSRRAVVVAVPTGSGWVDPDAVAGFRERLGGDVSVVSLAYDHQPSWRAFVTGTGSATAGAIALTAAIGEALDALDTDRRPSLYLYGQSLGAVGADAARRWARDHHVPVCASVVVGAPAGTVARRGDRRVVVVNSSDPVARWSPSLLWTPPARAEHADLPRPPWFPVASFVQTSVDLLGALSFPAGHGHQYGSEQGTRAPVCGRSTQIAPRAAS